MINKMLTRQLVISGARMNSCARLLRTLHNKPKETTLATEIEIPVPWGKISGQLWGSQDKQPILAMHGWQDNAASFSVLAPLIMNNTPVLSIDLPGHGLSSWLSPGSIYTEVVYILSMKRIVKHFGWEKVKFMGHSLSSMTTYWYAAMFPTEIQYVIALDYFKFPHIDTYYYAHSFGNAIESLIKLEGSMHSQLSYSQAEIKKKWLAGFLDIDDETCNILMTRGTRQKEDGTYVLNRDPRVRVTPIHTIFTKGQLEDFARLITCPYLVLRGTESAYVEPKEYYHNALAIMQQDNKDVYYEEVPGKHHFHLTHAEHAAKIINKFLEKFD